MGLTCGIGNLDHFEPVFRRETIRTYPVIGDIRPAGARCDAMLGQSQSLVVQEDGTRFLNEARGRGLTTISGLEMLVAQGARQFEIWTGLSAPRALMEQAVRSALNH